MIARIWHGWIRGDNAETYENLLWERLSSRDPSEEGISGLKSRSHMKYFDFR